MRNTGRLAGAAALLLAVAMALTAGCARTTEVPSRSPIVPPPPKESTETPEAALEQPPELGGVLSGHGDPKTEG
jgi:hypothetical protein